MISLLPAVSQVSSFSWWPAFKPGDQVFLSGWFADGISLNLAKSCGNTTNPIIFTSLNTTIRATIAPSTGHAIGLYDSATETARGLGITIMDLNLVGPGRVDPRGKLES